jgi:hypothetical protein
MKAIKPVALYSQARVGTESETGSVPVPAVLVPRRQLEKTVSWTRGERVRCLWYRLRLTVREMNYATRRTVEVQAPWVSGDCTRLK